MKVCGDFSSSKKALVLGAGYVSAPVIEYLTRDSDLGITVASALKVNSHIYPHISNHIYSIYIYSLKLIHSHLNMKELNQFSSMYKKDQTCLMI